MTLVKSEVIMLLCLFLFRYYSDPTFTAATFVELQHVVIVVRSRSDLWSDYKLIIAQQTQFTPT